MVEKHDHRGTMALGVEWAPISIPFERRLQTSAVFFHYIFMLMFCSTFVPLLALYLLFYTNFRWFVILYLIWEVRDFAKPVQGSRPSQWFRKSIIWKYFRDYFPVTLNKTVELDPNKNYIFGNHPHGLIGIGAFVNFATDATDFSTKFPGINVRLMTLALNFLCPLVRDYLMALGFCSVSKESISYLLSRPEKGYAVVIVVGGAQEALDAHPGQKYYLTLSNRKGFVKLAIRYGADLVPVFSFGENDLYWQADNPPGSFLRKMQMLIKKITGVAPAVFHGRGIFNYTMGLMPFRKPVNTVVGKPISVPHIENPNSAEIAEVHSRYVKGLQELFDSQKANYGQPNAELNIF